MSNELQTYFLTTNAATFKNTVAANFDIAAGVTVGHLIAEYIWDIEGVDEYLVPLVAIHGTIGVLDQDFTARRPLSFPLDTLWDTSVGTGLEIVIDATGAITDICF